MFTHKIEMLTEVADWGGPRMEWKRFGFPFAATSLEEIKTTTFKHLRPIYDPAYEAEYNERPQLRVVDNAGSVVFECDTTHPDFLSFMNA